MKSDKTATKKLPHPWSTEALLNKAQRFAEEMLKHAKDDWQFALWSSLLLELVGRAALARVSPALLADVKDWNNLYYSLGFDPTASKFVPKSIDISNVFSRLREIVPAFTTQLEGFSVLHMNRRNEELHAGSLPFESINTTTWLPTYYEACSVLLDFMGTKLDFLIGTVEAKVAKEMITASRDESAKAVGKSIAAHKAKWEKLSEEDRNKLARQASTWAMRQEGHRVKCPSCENDALVTGAAIAAPLRTLDGESMVEIQQYLPSKFECVACLLKISGLPQLTACGLGNTYKVTSTYDLAEYYASNDPYAGYEDDNNEP
jgi:hypothetical protein